MEAGVAKPPPPSRSRVMGEGARQRGGRKNGRGTSLEVPVTGPDLKAGHFPANVFRYPKRCIPFK